MDKSNYKGQDFQTGMNEAEFKEKWQQDKPVYRAWGEYVVDTIIQELQDMGKNIEEFLKAPAKYRLKEESSLIDKAFYRPGKSYSDPYNQIEDKVGARFIVLLLDDINVICDIIRKNQKWNFNACKHFDEDRKKDPLLFTYQSVHFVLQPKEEIDIKNIAIPTSVSCEVQIRTLLQHAHAELTHDAIYKAKKKVQPRVHRTVAKSMALIETTDDFFTQVTELLNYGPLEEHSIINRLDGLYFSITGIKSHTHKSSIVIWDVFEHLINDSLIDNIQEQLTSSEHSYLSETIRHRYAENAFYQQSTVLFLYWMLLNKKQRLLRDWPFQQDLLQPLAVDLGVSTWDS